MYTCMSKMRNIYSKGARIVVFKTIFNNMSVILWR